MNHYHRTKCVECMIETSKWWWEKLGEGVVSGWILKDVCVIYHTFSSLANVCNSFTSPSLIYLYYYYCYCFNFTYLLILQKSCIQTHHCTETTLVKVISDVFLPKNNWFSKTKWQNQSQFQIFNLQDLTEHSLSRVRVIAPFCRALLQTVFGGLRLLPSCNVSFLQSFLPSHRREREGR